MPLNEDEPKLSENIVQTENIVQIKNICISYGSKAVIKDFSLTLSQGQKIVLEGTNGCGKTTLLKCILGSVKPQSGKIIISNKVKTAYCKQGFPEGRTPVSVYEVVAMGLYKAKDKDSGRVVRAMQKAGIESLANCAFESLSGGEKQKVSLARCFCQDANLLLLDEPSSFLDVSFREEFIAIMKTLPSYMSAIVVTHDQILARGLGWQVVRFVDSKQNKQELDTILEDHHEIVSKHSNVENNMEAHCKRGPVCKE